MLIAEKLIKYNGVNYNPGSELPEMPSDEAERLIRLKAAKNQSKEPELNTEPELESGTDSQKTDNNPGKVNKDEVDYNEVDYNDLLKEAKHRKLKLDSTKKPEVIEALEADDEEFEALCEEIEAKNIQLPEGFDFEKAITNDLKELLKDS